MGHLGVVRVGDLRRTFSAADLLVREGGDGRTISGIVVPFNDPSTVRDAGGPAYEESFQRGAFAKTLSERRSPVKLLMHHDDKNPIGVASLLEERDEGLYGEFRVSHTRSGDDALALVQDGALGGFSIGFIPVIPSQKSFGRSVVRTEVKLRETSLVTFPAYEGAQVTGVRSLADLDPDELTDEQIASLARRMDALVAARATATPESGAGTGRPPEGHLGRVLTGLTAAQRRERLYPYLTERA